MTCVVSRAPQSSGTGTVRPRAPRPAPVRHGLRSPSKLGARISCTSLLYTYPIGYHSPLTQFNNKWYPIGYRAIVTYTQWGISTRQQRTADVHINEYRSRRSSNCLYSGFARRGGASGRSDSVTGRRSPTTVCPTRGLGCHPLPPCARGMASRYRRLRVLCHPRGERSRRGGLASLG